MPVRNAYQHYNLSGVKKNIFNIAKFGGVDLSSQAFNVDPSRAVRIKNYLFKNGLVRKRNGYEQIFKVETLQYYDAFTNTLNTNSTNFNGIWKFKAEDGEWHIVAHIGNLLYEIKNIERNNDITIAPISVHSPYNGYPMLYKFEDYKSSAFVGNNRLWFLGGNKYMCLRFFVKNNVSTTHFYSVADSVGAEDETERPFIPTTTINITCTDSLNTNRATLDLPNKLSYWKRNTLLTNTERAEKLSTDFIEFEYILDSPILFKDRASDIQKMTMSIDCKRAILGIPIYDGTYYSDNFSYNCSFESASKATVRRLLADQTLEEYDFEPEGGVLLINTIPTVENGSPMLIGFVYDIGLENKQAKVVFYNDFIPYIKGTSCVSITFPCYYEESVREINECRFGCLFGSNNAKNRLFLSGNPKIPNADWHSSEPNYVDYDGAVMKNNGNFSYFTDMSIMYYGETDNKVVGYEVVSNDKLLVLKDKSDKEKSVYFRTPALVTAIDVSGTEVKSIDNSSLYQEEFALVKGNNSVAGISPKTIVNFNGDTLFIDSNNQLVGLDIAGIIGDNQRYANSRSEYIDRSLTEMDLSESVLWSDNNYLFLSIKDFGIFATNFKTYNKDSKQYEWFYLTCENPTVFLEKDGVYYFANDNGELYKVNNGVFDDIKKVYCEFTLNYSEGRLVVDGGVIAQLKENEPYFFKPLVPSGSSYLNKVFYRIALMNNTAEDDQSEIYIDNGNNCIEIRNNAMDLPEEAFYYLSSLTGEEPITDVLGDIYGVKIKVEKLDSDGNDRYVLKKQSGNDWVELNLEYLEYAVLCGCLEDEDVDVSEFHAADPEDENDLNTITLSKDGEVLNLIMYGNQSVSESFKSEIKQYFAIEAYYLTAPFVFGSLERLKTIYSFTITNDAQIPSELEVGFASNKLVDADDKTMSYMSLTKEKHGFEFDDFNFQKVDYDKIIVSRTYTFHRILARQKFICFAFKNSNNTDSVLSGMSITYSTPFPSYSGD